jgi:hypothetical protein
MLIVRQRVAKHIPAEANAWYNRRSIARQRRGKLAFVNNTGCVFRGVRAKWI